MFFVVFDRMEWFRPAVYFLVKIRGLRQKKVAELFGVKQQKTLKKTKFSLLSPYVKFYTGTFETPCRKKLKRYV